MGDTSRGHWCIGERRHLADWRQGKAILQDIEGKTQKEELFIHRETKSLKVAGTEG